MDFNEIKAIRNKLNLTQEDLSILLGVNRSTIAKWEMAGNTSNPTGEYERKLLLLQKFSSNESEKKEILKILNLGGLINLGALLTASAIAFPVTKMAIGGVALKTILSTLKLFGK